MTLKESIYERFLDKIEQDRDFFDYYKLQPEESLTIVKKRCSKYFNEAITLFKILSEVDYSLFHEIDYHDPNTNEVVQVLGNDLSDIEIDILANLMREIHYYRGYSRLKAMEIRFNPKDLNVFSPANERKTFMDMVEKIQQDNRVLMDLYNARDRETGRRLNLEWTVKG